MHKRLHAAIALVDLRPGRDCLAFLDLLQQLPMQRVLVDPVRDDRRCGGGCRIFYNNRRWSSDCRRRYHTARAAVEGGFGLLPTDWFLLEAREVLLGSLFCHGGIGEGGGGFLDLGFVDHDLEVAAVRYGGARADGGRGATWGGLRGGGWFLRGGLIGDLGDDRGWGVGAVDGDVVGVSMGFKVQVGGERFAAPVALVDAVFRVHFDDVVFEPGWEGVRSKADVALVALGGVSFEEVLLAFALLGEGFGALAAAIEDLGVVLHVPFVVVLVLEAGFAVFAHVRPIVDASRGDDRPDRAALVHVDFLFWEVLDRGALDLGLIVVPLGNVIRRVHVALGRRVDRVRVRSVGVVNLVTFRRLDRGGTTLGFAVPGDVNLLLLGRVRNGAYIVAGRRLNVLRRHGSVRVLNRLLFHNLLLLLLLLSFVVFRLLLVLFNLGRLVNRQRNVVPVVDVLLTLGGLLLFNLLLFLGQRLLMKLLAMVVLGRLNLVVLDLEDFVVFDALPPKVVVLFQFAPTADADRRGEIRRVLYLQKRRRLYKTALHTSTQHRFQPVSWSAPQSSAAAPRPACPWCRTRAEVACWRFPRPNTAGTCSC